MLSRRLLRIKILQSLYAHYKSQEPSLAQSEKQLFFSIEKTYDLYHYLLLLIIEIVDYAESRIELAKKKKIPTSEDLNPNTRFIENKLVRQLKDNVQLITHLKKTKLSWVNYPELIKGLFMKITESDDFKRYMSDDKTDYDKDKRIIARLFTYHIVFSEELYSILEEQSIFWNDDVQFVINMIVKTTKKFREETGTGNPLMPMYRNPEDKEFVKRLFRKAIIHEDEYIKLIEKYTTNWEIDRIAFMDILVMQLGIAEIIEFQDIPTKVSFNEYLEIAKFYSTPKSSHFINGILDKVIHQLKKDKIIVKKGRGLVGEET
ncbi:MAG: transcription antitermination factor NusB [Bacteroidales bacterium]|nr:MAG: transcription antitermination factor NusB [Bacteroidales bacterium]